MSVLLWSKEITLILLIGECSNANLDCRTISAVSSCKMQCSTNGLSYRCTKRGLIDVPSFPNSTTLIDLSYNAIRTLYSDTFTDNLHLYIIYLDSNYLTTLPEDLFKTNIDLGEIYISENHLTTLPIDLFASNRRLVRLDISSNNLTSIAGSVFKYNVALIQLKLSTNHLTGVPDGIFRTNVNLAFVDLSYNSLTTLSDGVFRNNEALESIDCKECFDCGCMSASAYQWITKSVKYRAFYQFTCRDGVAFHSTVVNCSDDGSRLSVTNIQNESLCNCEESISMKSSSIMSTDLTETTPDMESTIETTPDSYTYIAGIISGIVSSVTLITAIVAIRQFINTTSRIEQADHIDTENTINDGTDFIRTIHFNGQMDQICINIPPRGHMLPTSFSNISSVHHIMVLERNLTNLDNWYM